MVLGEGLGGVMGLYWVVLLLMEGVDGGFGWRST